ncbi:FeoC-like transcriptional regulator [Cereibacter ovatus]|uniref:FeoC-like transcriptional regulator n=1 Tax=Cereibacter ovatus TaxID=439529 RepID=A0A285D290_9RHOB|nr:FeoC-like transcriptional regulator [Cereibacter ovatus]SNX73892.1 FeoC-like transcriptional regulator [Cereibacter ovatus]
MLLEVRSYLRARRQASLSDLAIRFRSQPDAMRGMLDHWIAKGKVRRIACASACGKGCGGCSAASQPEVYEWLEVTPNALH